MNPMIVGLRRFRDQRNSRGVVQQIAGRRTIGSRVGIRHGALSCVLIERNVRFGGQEVVVRDDDFDRRRARASDKQAPVDAESNRLQRDST